MVGTAIRGAAAGVVGTAALSAATLAGKAAGVVPRSPPHLISGRLGRRLGLPLRPDPALPPPRRRAVRVLVEPALWSLGHFGYGAAWGAAFAVGRRLLPRRPVVAGLLFGAGLWTVSYVALVPALRLYPFPWNDLPGRRRATQLGHLLYGVALAAIEAASRPAARADA